MSFAIDSKLFDIQLKYVDSLNKDIINSLKWYTNQGYVILNNVLRKNLSIDEDTKKHLKNIDLAFKGVPRTTNIITVYKGLTQENFISDKGFMSTTLDKKLTDRFTESSKCCIAEITIAKGSKILPLYKISYHDDELEILLNRDGNIQITNIDKEQLQTIINCIYSDSSSVIVTKKDDSKSLDKKIQIMISDDEKIDRIVKNIIKMYKEEEDIDFDFEHEIEYIYKQLYKQPITKQLYNIIYSKIKSQI